MEIAGIVIGVAIILLIAYVLGSSGGPFCRYLGKTVRAGRVGGPLGTQPEDPERQFAKPQNETDLL
jgi:hypothetical protein